jgi:subtilisin family serine protease
MTAPGSTTSPAAVVAACLAGAWLAGVTVLLQSSGWLVEQVLLVAGLDQLWWLWPVLSLLAAVSAGVPALLLALLPASAPVRQVGRAWTGGACALALLGPARVVPGGWHEWYLAVLAVTALVLAAAWRRRARPAGGTGPVRPAGGPAAVAGLVVLLPWLWVGALGGALETLLAVIAAAALGWLAAGLLDPGFWEAFGTGHWRPVLVGGPAAAVTLLLLSGGAGASGAHLPLMLVLPPLGLVAATLPAGPRSGSSPLLLLVGTAALGPLAFVDPREVTLLLAPRDVPFWTAVAATASLVLALLVAVVYLLVRPDRTRWAGRRWAGRRWVAVTVVAGVAAAAVAVHLGLGQPGLHGDRLFVVMADRADLSGLPTGTGQAGRDARAAEVYRRLVARAGSSQADLRADLDRLRLPYTPYYLVNGLEVAGGPELRAWLSGRDDVDRVLRSQRLRPLPEPGPAARGRPGLRPRDPEWNIAMVGADRVWRDLGVTGHGIVVGTSDSGVDGDHPALAGGFRGGDDSWFDPWRGSTVPTDRYGHGTHTLGSAVGRGGIGVAPGAQWIGCTNLERNLGNPARYLDCLQFMLAPYPPGADPWRDGRPDRAPHVLTNSWGCPPIEGCDATVLRPATAALHAAGIYLAVAAGNTGPFCGSIDDPPAPYPDVLTVGAVDRGRRVASFSSRGPVDGGDKPDLVAPGVAVVSAMPGGGYESLSGTSMATPQVAGVVALMWSASPGLVGDVDTTTRILRATATPLPVAGGECGGAPSVTGAGLVDAYAAVSAARAGPPP